MSLLLLFNPTEAGPTSVTLAPATVTLTAQSLASAVLISGNLLTLLQQDFEDNGHGYTGGNDSSLSRTSLAAADGRFALRLQKGSTATYLDMYAAGANVTSGISGSTSYTVSFQRRAETTGRFTQIVVDERDAVNAFVATQSSTLQTDYTTTWSVQTFTLTTAPTTARLFVYLYVADTPALNEAHYFDYVAVRTDPNPPLPPDSNTATLSPVTATVTAQPLSFTYGTLAQSLNPAAATLTARPLTFTYGAVTKTLSPATVTLTSRPLTFVYGTISRTLNPATITVTPRPLSVTYGAISVVLASTTVSLIARPLTFSYGLTTKTLAAAPITVTPRPLSFIYGLAEYALSAVTITLTTHPLSYIAGSYTFAFLGSTITLTPAAPNFTITGGPTSFPLHTTSISFTPRPATFNPGTKTFAFARSTITVSSPGFTFRIPGILTQPIYIIFTGETSVDFDADTLDLWLENDHPTLELEG